MDRAPQSWLFLGVILAASIAPLSAQAPTAAVTGTVLSTEGDLPVIGADVLARNTATGYEYQAVTFDTGRYWLRGLSPGTYDISVARIGLRPQVRRAVVLSVGSAVTLDFGLGVSAVALDPLEVVVGAPLIETTESEVSYVFDREQIARLPEESRQFADLALLVPGATAGNPVSQIPTVGTAGASVGALNTMSLGVLVDGVDFTEPAFGEIAGGLPLLAVQEFEVIQSNYSAELGRAASGIISAVTRRGGNELTFDAFGSFRDRSLNALGKFETEKPDFSRSHWGAAVGGPIVRDKTHFFAALERRVQNDFATVNTGGVFPEFEGTFKTPLKDNLLFGRIDHRINTSNDLTLRYTGQIADQLINVGGSSSLEQGIFVNLDVHSVSLSHRWAVSPRAVNQARFHVLSRSQDLALNAPPGPMMVFPSVTRGPFFGQGGIGATRVEFKDDFSLALSGGTGDHLLKFGAHLGWHSNDVELGLFHDGLLVFLDDADTAPFLAQRQLNEGVITLGASNTQLGFYVQDDWNPTPNLTLNIGLRYDIETNGTNQGYVSPLAGQLPFIRTKARSVDKNNIAPRLGFAWDPSGEGRTVVRGGFGIFYDASPMYPASALERSSGLRSATVFFPGTTDIDAIFAGVDPATAPAQIWPTGDLDTPMTRQFSLGFQHAFPADILVRVDGVYNEARNLMIERNLATFDPATGVPRYPEFSFIGQIVSEGEAEAKMLMIEASKSFSGGWVRLAYTLADRKNNTDAWNDFSAQVDPSSEDFSSEWGPAAWDERHRLTATGGADLPHGVSFSAKLIANSARPWSAYTGTDDNGDGNPDGRLNDRPAGEGRHTRRGPNFFRTDVSLRWTPTIGGGGRVAIMANVYNLFNRTNLAPTSLNRNLLSPSFGEALAALPKRQLELSVQVSH
jgi:outer membrane receptor protein involved in Fe transport